MPVLFGLIVGFSLGLTGGGGSIFAVPLLVYGMAIPAREAVALSLAAVGATALFGAIERLRAGEVEVPTALIFSAGGIVGAPVGAWTGGFLPDAVLLILFAMLMLVVAVRMWVKASSKSADNVSPSHGACTRDADGRLRLGSKCAQQLALVGLATGVLSGVFGVGGGFVIVPALLFFSGMPIHRAVATSLLAIALISASGITAFAVSGRPMPLDLTAWFVLGGIGGMIAGTHMRRRLPAALLQRGFAVAMVGVAAFIVSQRWIAAAS